MSFWGWVTGRDEEEQCRDLAIRETNEIMASMAADLMHDVTLRKRQANRLPRAMRYGFHPKRGVPPQAPY